MQELVEYIVKNIVSLPDAVKVEVQQEGTDVTVNLEVDPVDMGLIIGKSGQTIKAIRKILTVRAMAEEVRVYLQLVEPKNAPEVAAKAEA